MKADKQMLRSELDYIKTFLSKQFSRDQVKNFMILFKDIIISVQAIDFSGKVLTIPSSDIYFI